MIAVEIIADKRIGIVTQRIECLPDYLPYVTSSVAVYLQKSYLGRNA